MSRAAALTPPLGWSPFSPASRADGRGWPRSARSGAAADYVRDHLGEPLRLADIAGAVGYSERVFGMTVRRFVIRSRVQATAHELTTTDRSVTAVAMRCGFGDPSAFSHCFRAETGHTPRVYRGRHLATLAAGG